MKYLDITGLSDDTRKEVLEILKTQLGATKVRDYSFPRIAILSYSPIHQEIVVHNHDCGCSSFVHYTELMGE